MRQLIALRKRHPVLGRGDIEFLDPDNPHVLAFIRDARGRAAVPVRRQPVAPRPARRARPARPTPGTRRSRCSARPASRRVGERPYHLTLAPYGFFWFVAATPPPQRDARSPSNHRRCTARGPRCCGAAPALARAIGAVAASTPLVRGQGAHDPRRRRRGRQYRCATPTPTSRSLVVRVGVHRGRRPALRRARDARRPADSPRWRPVTRRPRSSRRSTTAICSSMRWRCPTAPWRSSQAALPATRAARTSSRRRARPPSAHRDRPPRAVVARRPAVGRRAVELVGAGRRHD